MPDRPPRAARRLLLGVAFGALVATPALAEVRAPRPPRRVRRAGPAQTQGPAAPQVPAARPPTPPTGTRPGTRGFMSGGGGDGTGI